MAARCTGARTLGLASLPRHRLAIMLEGYLTVAPDPRGSVQGVLWDVPLAAVPALDRYEEVGRGLYTKRRVTVVTATGSPKPALVYLGANRGPGVPRPGYLELVLQAAVSEALPKAALAEISALLGRSNRDRRYPASASPRPSGSRSGWPSGTNSSDTELMQ